MYADVRQDGPWHQLLYYGDSARAADLPRQEVNRLLGRARELYADYAASLAGDELTEEMRAGGTLKDRIALYRVQAQERPLGALEGLRALGDMLAGKPRVALDAMAALVQIYAKSLLPDRALRKFDDQPLRGAKDFHLIVFFFEDQLKIQYAAFVESIGRLAKSVQQFVREPAIKAAGELLRAKPENERALLALLVDKFGDPLKQVAAAATRAILDVLRAHPQMNQAVIAEIKTQLPNFSEDSQKRAMNFIGQISLGKNDAETARELLNTVKPQILKILGLKQNVNENAKVLKSLMRSAQKCAAVCEPKDMAALVEPLYRYVKTAGNGVSLPALNLLYEIHKAAGNVPNQFYEYFFNILLSFDFSGSGKLPNFLNLLMEALLAETNCTVVAGFVHRLLHVALEMNTTFAAAVLIFTIKIFEGKKELETMFKNVNPEAERNFRYDCKNPAGQESLETFPWILSLYMKHFNPTIRALAKSIFAHTAISYETDPFDDFATTTLLGRIAGTQKLDNELLNKDFMGFDEIPDFIDDDDDELPKETEKKESKKRNKQQAKVNNQKQNMAKNKKAKNNKKGHKN